MPDAGAIRVRSTFGCLCELAFSLATMDPLVVLKSVTVSNAQLRPVNGVPTRTGPDSDSVDKAAIEANGHVRY